MLVDVKGRAGTQLVRPWLMPKLPMPAFHRPTLRARIQREVFWAGA